MQELKNTLVKIDASEGQIDRVEYITKQPFTNSLAKVSNWLNMVYEPQGRGYTKVWLLVKNGDKTIRVRRDLAADEDTPASIVLELIKHDQEAAQSN